MTDLISSIGDVCMDEKSPVFVKIDDYQNVLGLVEDLKKKKSQVKETISKVNELREKERETLEFWEQKLEDVDKKILYLDQTLFEPESK